MQKYFLALFLSTLLPALIHAADPPPEVDSALRARVQEFYQLQVDHKFRQSETLVASDSKDFYYESKKPELKEFGITKIEYSPDFQKAKVSLVSKTQVILPGAGATVLDLPFYTAWKIEDGKWCWFADPDILTQTPFGKVSGGKPGDPTKLFKPGGPMQSVVEADPNSVKLNAQIPVPQTVTLKNTLPGPISISIATETPALLLELAKPNLAANESTTLKLTPTFGVSERPDHIEITVQPLNQTVTIAIEWAK